MRVLLLTLAISVLGTARLGAQAGAIEGTVVNAVTGAPVAHALVWAWTQPQGEAPRSVWTYTDGEGRWRLEHLDAGSYQVMGRKGGYLLDATTIGQTRIAVRLESGERKGELALKLVPQAVISGRVLDEFGEPAQGAMVKAFRAQAVGGKASWTQTSGGVATDDLGMFRLPNLGAGRYVVGVEFPDPMRVMPGVNQPSETYATTYYPKATEAAEGQVVEVAAGGEKAGVEIRMQRVAAYQVRGRVVSKGLETPMGFSVTMRRSGAAEPGVMAGAVRTGLDGRFEVVGVRNGAWTLVVQVRRVGNSEPLMGAVAVEVKDRDVDGVEVPVSEGIKVEGRLVAEGLAQAPQWKGFMAQLMPAEQIAYGWMQMQPVREDGSFTLVASLPGKYTLQVNGPTPLGTYLDSVKMGGKEYLGRELDLTESAVGPVQVTYRAGGGSLRIDVSGEKAGAGAATGGVLLIPKAVELRKRPFLQFRPVMGAGSVMFAGLRPGEYLAVAVADADYNTIMQGDIPQELLAAAVPLQVGANGTAQVALKPVPMPAR